MQIGAYYYPWYSGRWLGRTARFRDRPLLGQYDNHVYGDEIIQHIRDMKKYGIDFAAVSWEPTNTTYEHVLDIALEEDFPITVFYESLCRATGKNQRVTRRDFPKILEDMEQLACDMRETAWLKIDGKPVLMLYVTRNYDLPDDIFPAIRKVLGNVFLVGDEVFWATSRPERLKYFDAVTSYNFYQPGRFKEGSDKEICDSFMKNIQEAEDKSVAICRKTGVPYWPVAMPGYNDTRIRPQAKHAIIPRLDGYFYEQSLKNVLRHGSQVCMICTYNEWYEDSQIEPAKSYGNKYLEMTKKFKDSLGQRK